jgi:hypothetical protein
MRLSPTKRPFEDAVIRALGTLPIGVYQRIDGLMCEHVVLMADPIWFPRLRLWWMEKRGLIESTRFRQFWPSCQGMKSYRLTEKITASMAVKYSQNN